MPDNLKSTWDSRYNASGYAYGKRRNDFLFDQAHRLRSPVLSLGEGEGRNAVYLTACGFDVTAVDSSSVGLKKARALAEERDALLSTLHADLTEFDLGHQRWGSILSIFCHLPPEDRADLHRRVVDALVPGGVFVLEAFTPAQIGRGSGGPPTADLMMSLAELRGELSGLKIVVGREVERDLDEGRLHRGAAAVVQVVGIKS